MIASNRASCRVKDPCWLPSQRTETLETHARMHEETHEGRCKSPLCLQTGNARKGLIRMTRKVHSGPAAVIFLARARREREREREGGSKGGFRAPLCKPHLFKMSYRLPPGVFSPFSSADPSLRDSRARKSDASSCRAIRIHRRRIMRRKMD